MIIGTLITRKALTIVASVAAAALAAPAALADPPQGHRPPAVQPDLVERWVDGRAGTGYPDLFERYVATHSAGFVRDDPDGYQPQLRTAASPAATSVDGGFGWGDAGIGALAGFALTLVAGGMLLVARGRSRIAHS